MSIRNLFSVCLLMVSTAVFASDPFPLVLNGDTLPLNRDFTRKQCGVQLHSKTMDEISGIACSRTTPGYIWMESDNISTQIIATTEKGNANHLTLRLNLSPARWDWEDMCGGIYNGKNYLFIGAIGDNSENQGEYYIHYFEEPEIPDTVGGTKRITAKSINFQYPDGVKNNAEAIMYDNVEQMLYIITKKYYQPCKVYKLPFRTDYNGMLQTLEYVCDLGVMTDIGEGVVNGSTYRYKGFHLVTAADISPDGKYILIKNHNNTVETYSWTLLWTREGNESIGETLKNRQPEVIASYQNEWQGEAICWLDSYVFYTTSDDDGDPPIYKYRKAYPEGIETIKSDTTNEDRVKVLIGNTLYISTEAGLYTMDGRLVR